MDSPSTVYVNATALAGLDGGSTECTYTDNRSGGWIVPKANDYSMSVVRMTAQGLQLPVFIPIIAKGSDPNLTIYQIRLQAIYDNGAGLVSPLYSVTVSAYWSPQDTRIPTPYAPTIQQADSRYYWADCFDHFLNSLDGTLRAAANSIQSQMALFYSINSLGPAPDFTSTLRFMRAKSLGGFGIGGLDPTYFYSPGPVPSGTARSPISAMLQLNEPLYQLFAGVPNFIVTSGFRQIYGSEDGEIAVQQLDSADNWSPISELVITTMMPVTSEISSDPCVLGSGDFTSAASNNRTPAMTTWSLPMVDGAAEYTRMITMSPNFPRWIELNSSEPLTSTNFQLLWRNRYTDALNVVTLNALGYVSLKILLQRKW